jgi:hypothetical protein
VMRLRGSLLHLQRTDFAVFTAYFIIRCNSDMLIAAASGLYRESQL